ncbi:hypothetical protein XENOCAPTIV_012962, partial [Xenoophorus captivus]
CNCDLAQSGFFQKKGEYICTADYQRLYGTRCDRCDSFITGEVVSALGRTPAGDSSLPSEPWLRPEDSAGGVKGLLSFVSFKQPSLSLLAPYSFFHPFQS